jgi:hypothetical protein
MTRVKLARAAGEDAGRTAVPAVVLPYKPAAARAQKRRLMARETRAMAAAR